MKIPDIQSSRPQEIPARNGQAPAQTQFSNYLSNTKPGDKTTPSASAGAKDAPSADRQQTVFSPEEREYFAQLFPGTPVETSASQTYSPTGIHSTVASGSLLDRKG